ncbi:MAG: HIT family protein [Acidimicrobiales bacterium]
MVAACPFCQIVAGARPAHVVLSSPDCLAFLDTRPLFPGHTLLVPRDHCETLGDLPAATVAPLFGDARRLARAVEVGLAAAGSLVLVNNRVSQSIPHLHVHVVPRNRKDGLRGFLWPRQRYRGEQHMAEVAATLRTALGER